MQGIDQTYKELLKSPNPKKVVQSKRTLLEEHGKEGILYLLQRENIGTICFLAELQDPSCPWYAYKHLSPQQAIHKIWEPCQKQLPTFLPLLVERCEHLLVAQSGTEWQLIYFVNILLEDQSSFFEFYLGNAPLSAEEAQERPNITKHYQQHLGLFYQIHNGFGALYGESVLPLDELAKVKGKTAYYWTFYDFASKAKQCIAVQDLAQNNPTSYDYDGKRINPYYPFWQFIDERLAWIDEEE